MGNTTCPTVWRRATTRDCPYGKALRRIRSSAGAVWEPPVGQHDERCHTATGNHKGLPLRESVAPNPILCRGGSGTAQWVRRHAQLYGDGQPQGIAPTGKRCAESDPLQGRFRNRPLVNTTSAAIPQRATTRDCPYDVGDAPFSPEGRR